MSVFKSVKININIKKELFKVKNEIERINNEEISYTKLIKFLIDFYNQNKGGKNGN